MIGGLVALLLRAAVEKREMRAAGSRQVACAAPLFCTLQASHRKRTANSCVDHPFRPTPPEYDSSERCSIYCNIAIEW